MESTGIYAKYGKEKFGGYARVLLEIELGGEHSSVEVVLNDDEWNNQLRGSNYSDWLEGAIYGVEFALLLAGICGASVEIKMIAGLDTDSSPTNIAAAAADAVWKAVGFHVPNEITQQINQAVLAGWEPPCQLRKFS